MNRLILSENPDLVIYAVANRFPSGSPGYRYARPDDLGQGWRQFTLYFYEVNTGSETMGFVPTDYVDISGMRELKKAAMYAHKTQDPEGTYNNYFKPLEEFRGLEAGVKAAEAFVHYKDKTERATITGI